MPEPPASARPAAYLDDAERFAGRPLEFRSELRLLLSGAAGPGGRERFDELLFLAKFWQGALGVLRRTGPGADDVRKLSAELGSAAERLRGLLDGLARTAAPEAAEEFRSRFCAMDAASMELFARLVAELAALKNFELDSARQ